MRTEMIDGIAIGGYRSFGELQRIAPLGKVNIFVGANNCGKSNILRFVNASLKSTIDAARENREPHAEPESQHLGSTATTLGVAKRVENSTIQKLWPCQGFESVVLQFWKNFAAEDLFWFDGITRGSSIGTHDALVRALRGQSGSGGLVQRVFFAMSEDARRRDHSYEQMVSHVAAKALGLFLAIPPVIEIPIRRQLTASDDQPVLEDKGLARLRLDGAGAVRLLARMASPEVDIDNHRSRFQKLKGFFRELVDDQRAEIWVPATQDRVHCELHDQHPLRLEQLGSGIEQVILHAIVCTAYENRVVTFEEPELHLHPTLQRKLMRYLHEKTENQYFISTHSAHIIDTPCASVFHVTMRDKQSRVSRVDTHSEKWEVCQALGYRASDLVQTNCVIWVEGPSDRIYLRHWIDAADGSLKEHIHYSIMFYGGRLLSHLTAEEADECLGELINLRLINRNVCVIADSDKGKHGSRLTKTKLRLQRELTDRGGIAWITRGREVENYVAADLLRRAVDAVKPGYGAKVRTGTYAQCLPKVSGRRFVDKVKVSHAVASEEADLNVLDLRKRITVLANFIRNVNGLEPLPLPNRRKSSPPLRSASTHVASA